MTKKELAQSICNLVGESNMRTIANCYTRVRLTVKDPGNIKREELKKLRAYWGSLRRAAMSRWCWVPALRRQWPSL